MFVFIVLLFFVLTPGILFTLPPKSNKTVVALVNGVVFALIMYFTHNMVWNLSEGFADPIMSTGNSSLYPSDVNTSTNLLPITNKSEIYGRPDSGNMENQRYTPGPPGPPGPPLPIMTKETPAISGPQKNIPILNPPQSYKITDYIKYFNKYDPNNSNTITDNYISIVNSKDNIINFIKPIINGKQNTNPKIISTYKKFISVLNSNIN